MGVAGAQLRVGKEQSLVFCLAIKRHLQGVKGQHNAQYKQYRHLVFLPRHQCFDYDFK